MHRLLNWRLAVAALCLCLAGCVSENKGKLEGTRWISKAGEVTVKRSFSRPMSADSQTVFVPAGFMELDFQRDGSLFYILKGQIFTGKYSLGAGNYVFFELDEPVEGRTSHAEKIVIEGDELIMEDSDGATLRFRRQS